MDDNEAIGHYMDYLVPLLRKELPIGNKK